VYIISSCIQNVYFDAIYHSMCACMLYFLEIFCSQDIFNTKLPKIFLESRHNHKNYHSTETFSEVFSVCIFSSKYFKNDKYNFSVEFLAKSSLEPDLDNMHKFTRKIFLNHTMPQAFRINQKTSSAVTFRYWLIHLFSKIITP